MARLLQGILMTIIGLCSLLAWGYVVGWILYAGTIPRGLFVNGAYIPFWILAIIAFIISFAFMVLYVLAGSFDCSPRSGRIKKKRHTNR